MKIYLVRHAQTEANYQGLLQGRTNTPLSEAGIRDAQKLKEKLPNMTEEEQLELLASNGMLVKRPILITKDKIIIGYKEKNYQNLEG